jgi:hypothetical protein
VDEDADERDHGHAAVLALDGAAAHEGLGLVLAVVERVEEARRGLHADLELLDGLERGPARAVSSGAARARVGRGADPRRARGALCAAVAGSGAPRRAGPARAIAVAFDRRSANRAILGAHGAFPVVSTLVFYVARAAGMADWNATALEAQRATISLNIV